MTEVFNSSTIIRGGGIMPRKKSGLFDKAAYDSEYIRQHIIYRRVNFNKQNPEDQALLEWIDSQQESTAAYLRRLVREDMERRQHAE